MAGNSRRSRAENQPSQLLNNDENNTLFQLIGNRCNSLASAVVQVYLADPPSCQKWNKRCCGVATFIKDNVKRSYYIRIYDLKTYKCIWEQEIYNQFKYKCPRAYFHTFDTDNCPAGLNFANETEAENFKAAVLEKLQNRQQRKTVKRGDSGAMGGQSRPPPPPGVRTGPAPPPPAMASQPPPSFPVSHVPASTGTLKGDKGKNKGKKVKISKDDIGTPTDFRHVQHVGWDAEKGAFDVDKLDTDMKAFFGDIGISLSQLKDTETATFIYNFIEEHGGIDAIKQERQQKAAGRPPPPVPAMPAPPPPTRGLPSVPPAVSAPPPPSRGPPPRNAAPPPPPSMPRPGGGMAPPPGPPTRGPSAAPPPPPSINASPPPPPMSGPPPPPPPPPPMGGPPPPPGLPPPPGPPRGGNFLDEIQSGGGGGLRHVEQSSSDGSAEPEGRNALLAAIRGGSSLKPVTSAPSDRPKSEAESEGGLAGALMKALKAREAALRPDDDDDDEEVDDEEDWDD